jgi:hypothetical protein
VFGKIKFAPGCPVLFRGLGNHVDLRGLLGGAEGIRTAMLLVMRLGDRERSGTGWMRAGA